MRAALLTPADPPAFTVINGMSDAPMLFLCEHSGKAVPSALGGFGDFGRRSGRPYRLGYWRGGRDAKPGGNVWRNGGGGNLFPAGDRCEPPAGSFRIDARGKRRPPHSWQYRSFARGQGVPGKRHASGPTTAWRPGIGYGSQQHRSQCWCSCTVSPRKWPMVRRVLGRSVSCGTRTSV